MRGYFSDRKGMASSCGLSRGGLDGGARSKG